MSDRCPGAREQRPPLSPAMTGTDLNRWYWLKEELVEFARVMGLRTAGGKKTLTERITAHLEGQTYHEDPINDGRTPSRRQLQPPLFEDTLIPRGQRCSQVLRAWFLDRVGGTFRFDGAMRGFFADTDGNQTLGDALAHWRRTRDPGTTHIEAQFEYNLFNRAWYLEHPQGTRNELLSDWWQYRRTPIDERPRG